MALCQFSRYLTALSSSRLAKVAHVQPNREWALTDATCAGWHCGPGVQPVPEATAMKLLTKYVAPIDVRVHRIEFPYAQLSGWCVSPGDAEPLFRTLERRDALQRGVEAAAQRSVRCFMETNETYRLVTEADTDVRKESIRYYAQFALDPIRWTV